MTNITHVLGSDIPHHNLTVVNFFARSLSGHGERHRFMMVAADRRPYQHCTELEIHFYDDRKQLARALLQQARQQRQHRFLFHGQFNQHIWWALLTGRLSSQQMFWHVWGADLYEEATGWRAKLLYRLRRLAQGRVGHIFATRSDLNYFARRHPQIAATLLYFPTRMPECHQVIPRAQNNRETGEPVTLLLGNSGDRSNRHIEALQRISQQFGAQVRIVIPLGYPANNQLYIEQIRSEAEKLFPEGQVQLLREQMAYDDYLALIQRCDAGYFIFNRQQGIGTLCLLLQYNIPVILSRNNPFWQDMSEQRLPVLFYDDKIDETTLREAQQQLQSLDKREVAFFNPNYIKGWQQALQIVSGEPT
ncbi:MAG: TDP-N-acetylfucosamine:lipid II N-acetylfucosaminyltransferase [Enterobacteriaceae bacterium]